MMIRTQGYDVPNFVRSTTSGRDYVMGMNSKVEPAEPASEMIPAFRRHVSSGSRSARLLPQAFRLCRPSALNRAVRLDACGQPELSHLAWGATGITRDNDPLHVIPVLLSRQGPAMPVSTLVAAIFSATNLVRRSRNNCAAVQARERLSWLPDLNHPGIVPDDKSCLPISSNRNGVTTSALAQGSFYV